MEECRDFLFVCLLGCLFWFGFTYFIIFFKFSFGGNTVRVKGRYGENKR